MHAAGHRHNKFPFPCSRRTVQPVLLIRVLIRLVPAGPHAVDVAVMHIEDGIESRCFGIGHDAIEPRGLRCAAHITVHEVMRVVFDIAGVLADVREACIRSTEPWWFCYLVIAGEQIVRHHLVRYRWYGNKMLPSPSGPNLAVTRSGLALPSGRFESLNAGGIWA